MCSLAAPAPLRLPEVPHLPPWGEEDAAGAGRAHLFLEPVGFGERRASWTFQSPWKLLPGPARLLHQSQRPPEAHARG